MHVRAATVTDSRRIADIQVRAWHAAYHGLVPDSLLAGITVEAKTASWHEVLTKGVCRILVVDAECGVVGWASFGASRDPGADPSVGELYGMYVSPEQWRRGVGRALWVATEAELGTKYSTITLWVLETNRTARRFYEMCGFGPEPEMVDKPDWLGANRVRYRFRTNAGNFAS